MKLIPNAVTSKMARQILVGKKHSPTVLFAGGVLGVVTTTVLACRATLKLEQVLEDTQENLETARTLKHSDYSEDDRKKDVAYIYIRTVVAVTKLYGPAIIVGSASIAALAGSHNILTKRNAALTAAYAAVEKGFAEYRQRVVDEFGEDKDRELRYSKEVVEVEDEATGKKKKVTRVGSGGSSIYAKFFDDMNQNWSPTPEYNMMFLRCQQNYANDRLQAKGYILLNDVYDMLGIERTMEGCVVGWIKNNADNVVDFNIFTDENRDRFYDFVTGREGCILLDFNVDGMVYDLIGKATS